MLDILQTIKLMGMVNTKALKDIRMKVNGNSIYLMEKEKQDIQMEKLMMDK
jgi:hypothetical protein